MKQADLKQIQAAVAQEPRNAKLRYLLGAELAQQKDYTAAVVEMKNALELEPNLHFARFQLGLLYLTMAQADQSIVTWAPLELLDEDSALKFFKRGLEALIRDEFETCIGLLRKGIALNTQNAPLNRDMRAVIERIDSAFVPVQAPDSPAASTQPLRTDFSLYGEPPVTKH